MGKFIAGLIVGVVVGILAMTVNPNLPEELRVSLASLTALVMRSAAEQALRRGVLWRKRSFGSQSPAGCRFVERILTVVISLRRQQRDVLDFLTDACQALASGIAPPSLLPAA
jgi:Tfp pilus assembly protein PilX